MLKRLHLLLAKEHLLPVQTGEEPIQAGTAGFGQDGSYGSALYGSAQLWFCSGTSGISAPLAFLTHSHREALVS